MTETGCDPVVLITGCSTGLGLALAEVFHEAGGYRVVATARRAESLASLAALGIHCATVDVTSNESVATAVESILKQEGHIDILINNAGVSRIGPIVEQNISEIEDVFNTNVLGVVRMVQAVAPAMASRGRGLVVNIGSVTSQMTTPWSGAYSSSKAALRSLSDALRLELLPFKIMVTYVMAGMIRSRLADNSVSASDIEAYANDSSLYAPWIQGIAERARLSQASGCMEARDVAEEIQKVVQRSYITGKSRRRPPTWFLVGGNSFYYWLLGFVQMHLGWPVNAMLAKKFKLQVS